MRLHTADAADYVLKLAAEVQQGRADPLDMVFIDAFDGNDNVPDPFCSSGDSRQFLVFALILPASTHNALPDVYCHVL